MRHKLLMAPVARQILQAFFRLSTDLRGRRRVFLQGVIVGQSICPKHILISMLCMCDVRSRAVRKNDLHVTSILNV